MYKEFWVYKLYSNNLVAVDYKWMRKNLQIVIFFWKIEICKSTVKINQNNLKHQQIYITGLIKLYKYDNIIFQTSAGMTHTFVTIEQIFLISPNDDYLS